MHHCVSSLYSCARGTTSIWSLTMQDNTGNWRMLTLEVRNKMITQMRGLRNRPSTPKEINILSRWTSAHGIGKATSRECYEQHEISDERLEELSKRIKPIVLQHGIPHYIKLCDLRKQAFTWDPKVTERADGLTMIAEIPTYHTSGYYGFFKPSIAEVLSQIPEEHLSSCCAFMTERATAADLGHQMDVVNEGYHRAMTTLYKKD